VRCQPLAGGAKDYSRGFNNGVTVRLNHRVIGQPDRPTVLVGGSVGSTLATWDPQLTALSAEFQVIAYDHRGHGGSPAPAGPYSIEDLALDVVALLDDYAVARAHVVGLSLGGMLAQRIAARQPQRVDRLALLCTAAHYPDAQPWTERAATVRAGGTDAIADAVVDRWLTADYRRDHPTEVSRLREMVVSIDNEGYAACCDAIADMDLRPDLSRIQAPTLVIAGAEDPAVPPARMRELADEIAGSRFVTVPGAHVPPLEHPAIVTNLLLEHFGVRRQRLGNSE
ncbi:MAG: 3-oxoadipate enol-lactonase, partial [Nocardioidaceae bacterium]|nr:3-oxoadipate enol-lactonase [Nocardioidaceae bacterium]